MSDVVKPPIHGRDHRPGGSDPIPGLTAGNNSAWPNVIHLPVMELNFQSNQLDASASPTYAIDNLYPNNGYIQRTTQNSYIRWPVVLGPKGSIWRPYMMVAKGSDYGIFDFSLATAVTTTTDSDGLGGAGLFKDSSFSTFVKMHTFDMYFSGTTDPYPGASEVWPAFRIMGDDGAVGTTFTTPGGYSHYKWDGGAGPHFLELKVSSKNASSSGYRFRLSGLGLIRVDWDTLI